MDRHWLTRPGTIALLWVVFVLVLAGTVVAEAFIHRHAHFEVTSWFGFNAVFGFASCAVMIVGAKVIGFVLKRPDTYYSEDGDD
ncbi:MAG: hypothetical protein GC151_11945 [Betaproteobacteria bacterium]|nr:hypothetical protein [Betaproteobacteria bacterium]